MSRIIRASLKQYSHQHHYHHHDHLYLIDSFADELIWSLIHSLIHSFLHSFIHLFGRTIVASCDVTNKGSLGSESPNNTNISGKSRMVTYSNSFIQKYSWWSVHFHHQLGTMFFFIFTNMTISVYLQHHYMKGTQDADPQKLQNEVSRLFQDQTIHWAVEHH